MYNHGFMHACVKVQGYYVCGKNWTACSFIIRAYHRKVGNLEARVNNVERRVSNAV